MKSNWLKFTIPRVTAKKGFTVSFPGGPEKHSSSRCDLRGSKLSRPQFWSGHLQQRRSGPDRVDKHRLRGWCGRKRRRRFVGQECCADSAVALEAVVDVAGLEGGLESIVLERKCQRRESSSQCSVLNGLASSWREAVVKLIGDQWVLQNLI